MATIYLASPYGFSPATKAFLEDLRQRLRNAGHTVNDPWELGESLIASSRDKSAGLSEDAKHRLLREVNRDLGEMNQAALDGADIVLAALDGPDVDSGTASEVGYAFARGKKVIGLRGDFRLTGENEAATVNLQVQYWIEKSGGAIYRSVSDVLAAVDKSSRGTPGRKEGVRET